MAELHDLSYHMIEAARIQRELDASAQQFPEDGIIVTVLRQRIEQEVERFRTNGCKYCNLNV